MSFDLKHLPQTFADLVIANPLNAAVIKSYCEQPPAKPLLLAGPPGAGKTEAARVIAQSHFLREPAAEELHGKSQYPRGVAWRY